MICARACPVVGFAVPRVLHVHLVAGHAGHVAHRRVPHDRAGERGEDVRRMAQLAGGRAIRDVSGVTHRRHLESGGRHVGERETRAMALRATCGDAGVSGRTHDVGGVIPRRRVAHRTPRVRRNVIGRLAATRHSSGEGGRRDVAAPAIAGARMSGVERRRRPRIPRQGSRANDHP